jgi:hypothetical protein
VIASGVVKSIAIAVVKSNRSAPIDTIRADFFVFITNLDFIFT